MGKGKKFSGTWKEYKKKVRLEASVWESIGLSEQAGGKLQDMELTFKLNSSSSSSCRSWWELLMKGINRSTESRDTDKMVI